MKIRRVRSVNGNISLPGDKSISHRAAMIAAMAVGETGITNFAPGVDCLSTLSCLRELGVEIVERGTEVIVTGVGRTGFRRSGGALNCGNSGTTMRLLSGILAGQTYESTLAGDASLSMRPMDRIIEPLTAMGAMIRSQNGRAPLTIMGRHPLTALEYKTPTASAQLKSCILLAGLNAVGETVVIEPVSTRDHTERMLGWFGVEVVTADTGTGSRVSVKGGQTLRAADLSVPADISSAAFFIAAAVCLEGSDITLKGVGMNPSRRAFVDLLIDLGARIDISELREICNEPVAALRVRSGMQHKAETVVVSGDLVAGLIDEVPILAVLGTQHEGGLEIRDAQELRVKETDRITAIVENLRRMNATVVEFPDGFRVERSPLKGATVDSFGDHRIAMAFAIAGLFADGETVINGAECVEISFPRFFETLHDVIRC